MMTPFYVSTIFEAFENVGAKIAIITAKEKLRKLLGKNLKKAICFYRKSKCCKFEGQ